LRIVELPCPLLKKRPVKNPDFSHPVIVCYGELSERKRHTIVRRERAIDPVGGRYRTRSANGELLQPEVVAAWWTGNGPTRSL
jgi:hypothetical protein